MKASTTRLLACLICLALISCKEEAPAKRAGAAAGKTPKKAAPSEATRVEVAKVDPSRPDTRLVRPGEVIGAKEAALASALGGFVEQVKVQSGQRVKRGAVIAVVDLATHRAQARLASVEVRSAERELKRLESLGKAVATARVDAARTAAERARANHSIARLRVSRAVVRAPFAGVIGKLDVERGEVVTPGKTLARLIQTDPVHVSVSVSDVDVVAINVGATAEISTVASAKAVSGKVVRIEPAADVDTRTFLVRVEVKNESKMLRPGMIARVTFELKASGKQMLLPQDLLVTRRGKNGVFLVDDKNQARWRDLKLGKILGNQVIIEKGLNAGETIVVVGHRSLQDGDALMIARRGRCCTAGRVVYDQAGPKARAEVAP